MSEAITSREKSHPIVDITSTAEFILGVQKDDGEIPWSMSGKTDPWDHVESAMGLAIGGFHDEAGKAYRWSSSVQLPDGSWWSSYRDGQPEESAYKDSNMTAYIAVGVLHHYLVTADDQFLRLLWPTVQRAIDYVIKMQAEEGQILWAKRADDSVSERALLTGSSSIYLSLTCALTIASLLGEKRPRWETARVRLGEAIRHKPHLFDQSKARYAMDWYYPVLCGAVRGKEAHERIRGSWDDFIIRGWGVRCVSDHQWVTVAETSERVMALAAIGEFETAETVFGWIHDKKYEDGAFWTGVTSPEREIYPKEKTAWTAGSVLLAADLLYGLTPVNQIFSHSFWKPFPF